MMTATDADLALRLAAATLQGAAGLGLFLLLLSRVMMLFPDSHLKGAAIAFVAALLVGGGTLGGLLIPTTASMVVAALVLGGLLLGEVHRLCLRRATHGSHPIGGRAQRTRLTKPFTTTDIATHHYRVECPNWHGRPLRVAHLSDLHVNAGLPAEYYSRALALAAGYAPDLALFTGDFITSLDGLPLLRERLKPIPGALNVAVLGNHDYWVDPEQVGAIVEDCGILLLRDQVVTRSVAGGTIRLQGYDYPWGTRSRCPPPCGPEDALDIVLSHTPDNAYRLANVGADLIFSGHNHAGQLRLPWIGPVVIPSVYGRRFDHGHFSIGNTHLIVSAGVGSGSPPLRIFCQPDVTIVDIYPHTLSRPLVVDERA